MQLSSSFGFGTAWITGLPCDAGIRDRRLCILDLPEHILSKILGLLGHSFLLTARLTCKVFRAASIPCIIYISVDPCKLRWCEREGCLVPQLLQLRLRVFSSIRQLELYIDHPKDAAALEVHDVLSTLCKLHVLPFFDGLDCLPAVLPFLP
jgi:F-box domain